MLFVEYGEGKFQYWMRIYLYEKCFFELTRIDNVYITARHGIGLKMLMFEIYELKSTKR